MNLQNTFWTLFSPVGHPPQATSRSRGSCKAPQHRTTSQSSTTSLHQSHHNHLKKYSQL